MAVGVGLGVGVVLSDFLEVGVEKSSWGEILIGESEGLAKNLKGVENFLIFERLP